MTNLKFRKKNIKICKNLRIEMTMAGFLLLFLHILISSLLWMKELII